MGRHLIAGFAVLALAGCSSAASGPKPSQPPLVGPPSVASARSAELRAALEAYRAQDELRRACPDWLDPPGEDAEPLAALRRDHPELAADPPRDPARFFTALYRACSARSDEDEGFRARLREAADAASSPAAQELLSRLMYELRWRLHPAPTTFEALLEDRPRRRYWVGRLVYSAKEISSEVRAAFEAAHAADPSNPEAAFFVAIERTKAEAYREALALFERPDVAQASPLGLRYWRGIALNGVGEYAAGRADLLHLLEAATGSRRPSHFFWDEAHFPLGSLAGLRPSDVRCVLMRSHQAEGDLEAGLQHGLHAIGTSCWKELPDHFRKAKDDFHFLMTDGPKDYIEEAELYVKLGYPHVAKSWLGKYQCEPGQSYPSPEQCRRAARLLARLERKHPPKRAERAKLFPGLAARLAAPRRVAVREVERPAAAPADEALATGPEGHRVVYRARAGDRTLAVSVSQRLDRTGEVSRGGYWLHFTDQHGHWSPPIYTGLRESFPYVVRSGPPLPASGDVVVLPVDVKEIDTESIMFPPVGMRLKRDAEGLAIELSLAALARDTDGDGLTDLVEERLATDPERADTDGDGLDDAQDNLPLTPADATPPTEADELLTEILARVLGRTPAKIQSTPHGTEVSTRADREVVFIRSDRPAFAHSQLGAQVLLMPPEAFGAYKKKFGLTLPLRLGELIFNPDRTEALLTYSFGWRGGTIWARRENGRWVLTSLSEWIT